MGGHGGLNILPQKRWNVYNRDNRLKVARDEAEHAEQQRELDEKHKAAEAQARRKLLLERARERRAAALGDLAGNAAAAEQSDGDSDGALTAAPQQHQQEQARRSVHAAAAAAPAAAARDLQDNGQHEAHWQPHQQPHLQLELDQESQPVLEHINFWKDLESKAQHPEREKEQKETRKRRGNPDTYTTDARFDESFQLGYGLSGPKPWYARAVDPSAVPAQAAAPAALAGFTARQLNQQLEVPGDTQRLAADGKSCRKKRKRNHSSNSSSSSGSDSSSSGSESSSSSSDSDGSMGHQHCKKRSSSGRRKKARHSHSSSGKKTKQRQHRSSSKHKHKHKHDDKRKSKSRRAVESSELLDKSLALAQLRAQRLEREAAERKRALEATGQLPATSKRYNSSYGYADLLRAQHAPGAAAAAFIAKGASAAAVAGLGQRFSR